jgi:hypothetical protein
VVDRVRNHDLAIDRHQPTDGVVGRLDFEQIGTVPGDDGPNMECGLSYGTNVTGPPENPGLLNPSR